MTPLQLAEYFGVSRRTIYRWVDRGCPCTKTYDGAEKPKYKFDLNLVIAWRKRGR